jgi:hypothetical protein
MRRFIFLPLALFPVTNGAAAATVAVERGRAPRLFLARVQTESPFRPAARSRAGAIGLTPTRLFRAPHAIERLRRASRTILRLIAVTLLLGLNAGQPWRRPPRVVITPVSQRRRNQRGETVERRDRRAGIVGAGSDRIGGEEKRLPSGAFVAKFRTIDPRPAPGQNKSFRHLELEKMFRMMTPAAARQFADSLKTSGLIDREARANWQATWTDWEPNVETDSRAPFRVRIQGVQAVVKTVGGESAEQVRRLQFSLKLAADTDGRTTQNLLTGLRVIACDLKEIV